MLTKKGPRVLEYNARFGDPEAELIAVRMKSDLIPILQATLAGRLEEINIEWLKARSVCVVLASRGYPDEPEIGAPIGDIDTAEAQDGVEVFHAGTAVKDGKQISFFFGDSRQSSPPGAYRRITANAVARTSGAASASIR